MRNGNESQRNESNFQLKRCESCMCDLWVSQSGHPKLNTYDKGLQMSAIWGPWTLAIDILAAVDGTAKRKRREIKSQWSSSNVSGFNAGQVNDRRRRWTSLLCRCVSERVSSGLYQVEVHSNAINIEIHMYLLSSANHFPRQLGRHSWLKLTTTGLGSKNHWNPVKGTTTRPKRGRWSEITDPVVVRHPCSFNCFWRPTGN